MTKQLITSELDLWKCKWERERHLDSYSAIELLKACDKISFPHIHFLLKVLVTLPISVATAESTFSCLRRLTWLRSTMAEDRLVGLALLHIHRDIELKFRYIIDTFANRKKHRLEFIL